jgi:3-methyladenine DNA glycosylase AlkD
MALSKMKPSPETVRLASEIRSRINLSTPNTAAVRAVRREFSRQIAKSTPESVIQLALHLLEENPSLRFFSYELVSNHKLTARQLTIDNLLKLGKDLNNWSSVDSFAMILSGPMWARGNLSDKTVTIWARSEDLWWRRTALVSTVALSRRGNPGDLLRTAKICALLASDKDDMVVKALSWALRELAKKHPDEAAQFLTKHEQVLAARVIREVNNKLRTGLKTPRGNVKSAISRPQA